MMGGIKGWGKKERQGKSSNKWELEQARVNKRAKRK